MKVFIASEAEVRISLVLNESTEVFTSATVGDSIRVSCYTGT